MMTKSIRLDPTGYFKRCNVSPHRMIPALGLIPSFFFVSEVEGVDKAVTEFYPYGPDWRNDGNLEDDCFSYPGDPLLYPLAKYTDGSGEYLLQFENAVIAHVDSEGKLIKHTRMD